MYKRQSLDYVGGLWVNTRQGTLYYRYNSEGDTGAGVGTSENYYADPSASQMGLGDVAFVPKGDFSGTAVISYTGYARDGGSFQGTIEVEVEETEEIEYCLLYTSGFHSGEEPDDGTGSGGEHQFCGRKKHQYMEPRNGLRGSGE